MATAGPTTPPAAPRRRRRFAPPPLFPRINSWRDLFAPPPDGTKDIRQHPLFQGALSRFSWRIWNHRLTPAGRWILALTLVTGVAIAPGLDVQFYVPFLYLCALWGIAEAATLFNKPRVRLRARHGDRVRAGETLSVEVDIEHVGRFWPGMDLNILPTRLPLAVDAVPPEGAPVGYLEPKQSRRVRIGLSCPRRGTYRLWGYRVESDWPFGLLNAYGVFPQESSLIVYPAFEPLTRMNLPSGTRVQPGGLLLASKLGESMEYLGNREYREGDNVRDIDWRATARLGGQPIALREYREESFLRVGVVLDTFVPRRGRTADRAARAEAFERAVSLTAAIGDYLARSEYVVDLFAAGPDLYHLTAGRSLAYLDQILDILACVEGSETEPLAVIAPQIQEYLGRLTTVICVLLEWNEGRRAFVEGLRAGGAGVKVVLVRGGGVDTTGFPPDAIVIEPGDWARGGVTHL